MAEAEHLDVLVIGGGVIGLAVARAMAHGGRDVVLVERHTHLVSETSARNSQVIHAGLYYPENSLKARLSRAGNTQLYRYCAERNIANHRCGKLIVATSVQETAKLKALMAHAEKNGVEDLRFLTPDDFKRDEPELVCHAACLSPSTGVLDAHGFAQALETDLLNLGAAVVLRTTVESLGVQNDGVTVTTRDATDTETVFRARTVINAAGLAASQISSTLQSASHAARQTFYGKGHYFEYTGDVPFTQLIYPMPSTEALGIHFTRTIDGSVKFGPDFEWVETLDYAFDNRDGTRHQDFVSAIRRYWPNIKTEHLHPDMTGIRPKIAGPGAPTADFSVHDQSVHGVAGYIALYGIESPGLTASLPLADYVAALANTSH